MSVERVAELLRHMTEKERSSLWRKMKRQGLDVREVDAEEEEGVEKGPSLWGLYEKDVWEGSSEGGRAGASKDPECALRYALFADRGPHEVTRAGACRDPRCAYEYARYVDQGPRDDTRAAACRGEDSAYLYALFVDQEFRTETWEAVEGTLSEWSYRCNVGVP